MAVAPPPTGTITFLFTDIESSTRLWEEQPDAMRRTLAAHDALTRSLVSAHRGHVFKSIGDGFCAAFNTATDALDAAIDLQRSLAEQSLIAEDGLTIILKPEPLKVRCAIHTGIADYVDGDYLGPALNRVSRLLSAAHGGQVLLSNATRELTRDALPPGAALKDLGPHRLRDLHRPELIYQLLHPDLPADFPHLRSLSAMPNNLPRQLTSFIGREKEIADVKILLAGTRLLTITGPGGTGKTRLSSQVAADLLEEKPDGVWLIELAPLTDPALVPQAVAAAMGLRPDPDRSGASAVARDLRAKNLLIILDNCEHLVAAAAALAHELLRECPTVQILATSREPLGVPGETIYRLSTLSLPDPQRPPPNIEGLTQYEAVRLFIDRARAVVPNFAVNNANAPAVAQICYRLDGIPLAIELAAARVKSLPVEKIADRLDDRFRLLTGGPRTLLPRQQTLRALIDWSYDLLSEAERTLLRRLSVLAGGWTLEAAEAICGDDLPDDAFAIDVQASLVEKSLILYEQDADPPRYRLLETVRQYAKDRLNEAGEADAMRNRHRDYHVRFAEHVKPQLTGPEQKQVLDRLETEHDNFRAALEWSEADPAGSEQALRLCSALWTFWSLRGHHTEGRQHLARGLSRDRDASATATRARALVAAGALATYQGDYDAAIDHYRQAVAVAATVDDQRSAARALSSLAIAHVRKGQGESAMQNAEEAVRIARETNDRPLLASVLSNLGVLHHILGDHDDARRNCQEALAIHAALGDQVGVANALGNLGDLAATQGHYEDAEPLVRQSLNIRQSMRDTRGIALCLQDLGWILYKRNEPIAALESLLDSLPLFQRSGDRQGIAITLEATSILLAATANQERPQLETAATLLAATQSLRDALGTPGAHYPLDREQTLAHLRQTLAEDFSPLWTSGRSLTPDQAVTLALHLRPTPSS